MIWRPDEMLVLGDGVTGGELKTFEIYSLPWFIVDTFSCYPCEGD